MNTTTDLQARAEELARGYQSRQPDGVRQQKIEARAREIMIDNGMEPEFFTPHSPPWGPTETALRDKALAIARDEVSVELGIPQFNPANGRDDIDWSQEPRPALDRALEARHLAEQERDRAASIAKTASDTLHNCEAEAEQFNGLDARIEEYAINQVRAGSDDDLPYHLELAAKDRSKARDRLDRAFRVNKRLQAELLDAQRKLQQAHRLCLLWAQRIVIMHAETVAAALFEAQAKADALRDDLNAFSYCAFPGASGPPELTATLHRALRVEPKPREESHPKIEPLKLPWLKAFAALLDDPDAELGDVNP